MAENKEKLFDQFPGVSYEEWRAKVETDLKGADFNKKLVWRTNEGFNVQPIYRAEDIADLKTTDSLPGEFPYVRGTRTDNDWLTRQEIIADTAEGANEIALDVLNKGVTSLGFKVSEGTKQEIATLLKDIYLPAVEVNFTCCPGKALAVAAALVEYLKENNAVETFKGSIDYNPLRKALRHGAGKVSADVVAQTKTILEIVRPVKNLRVLSVDSAMLCNSGAYIFQELGYALAWGADWLTQLTEAGLDINEVANRVKFNMGVSSNFFMELAKFRAARMLWAQIVEQYKPTCPCAAKMLCHASTSEFNQTIFDAHVNLLRSQTETMSAALACVDSITVTPFDTPYKTPDAFSERIARNQQFLLKEESHLDKVVDPAGGSYYVETLTVSIANEAWKLFLDVVENGGFFAQCNEGKVQASVNESCAKRHTDVARRKEVLLGTNQYPNVNENTNGKIEKTGECKCSCGEQGEGGLSTKRAASDFEALRLARAQFSTNFFGCAGYEIIDNLGFNTVEEGVDAALAKGADVVVLCSSDDEYAELAPAAFKYLNGRAQFVVAGAPACTDDLKAVGINDFINVRSNVLETLKDFNNRLLK
jgi:methylmalonyl-CoA mutase